MRIFNLSDVTPPYKPERRARALKIRGVTIKPGEGAEIPDSVPTSDFSGWLVSNMVSIGSRPDWYEAMKQQETAAKLVEVVPELKEEAPEETPEETTEEAPEEPVSEEPEEPEIEDRPKKKGKKGRGRKS